jgi:hypothetical protein
LAGVEVTELDGMSCCASGLTSGFCLTQEKHKGQENIIIIAARINVSSMALTSDSLGNETVKDVDSGSFRRCPVMALDR